MLVMSFTLIAMLILMNAFSISIIKTRQINKYMKHMHMFYGLEGGTAKLLEENQNGKYGCPWIT